MWSAGAFSARWIKTLSDHDPVNASVRSSDCRPSAATTAAAASVTFSRDRPPSTVVVDVTVATVAAKRSTTPRVTRPPTRLGARVFVTL